MAERPSRRRLRSRATFIALPIGEGLTGRVRPNGPLVAAWVLGRSHHHQAAGVVGAEKPFAVGQGLLKLRENVSR